MKHVKMNSGTVPNATLEEMSREMMLSVIPLMVFISTTAVLGIFGNLFVIVIYSKRYPKCNFKYFVLILASIDMVSCSVLMPLETVTFAYWFRFPSAVLCKFKSALNAYTVTASASCLLLIAIDRFRKVCKPHSQQIYPKLALKLTAIVLILSAIPAGSDAIFWGLHTYSVTYKGSNVTVQLCEKDDLYKDTMWPKLHTTVLYTGTNVTVMVSTLFLYVLIAKKLFCQAGPILTPEIIISSPDMDTHGVESVFKFEKETSISGTRATIQSASDIETGFTESDADNRSTDNLSDQDMLDDHSDGDIPVAKADKTVRLKEPQEIKCQKKITRMSLEINDAVGANNKPLCFKIPEASMRTTLGIPSPSSSCSPSSERYRRRRSTLHSLKGHTGTKLRRKTLIMFILTIFFVVTTTAYLAMISHMADSSHFVQGLTEIERSVWLFFLRFYFINSFINPLLYGFLDTRFRRKLWDMGIRVRWLVGSVKRNIGESLRRSESGRTRHEVVMRPPEALKLNRRSKSSMTVSD